MVLALLGQKDGYRTWRNEIGLAQRLACDQPRLERSAGQAERPRSRKEASRTSTNRKHRQGAEHEFAGPGAEAP